MTSGRRPPRTHYAASPKWFVVRGTGRRTATIGFGCSACHRGDGCRCEHDARGFADVVGGTVVPAKEAA